MRSCIPQQDPIALGVDGDEKHGMAQLPQRHLLDEATELEFFLQMFGLNSDWRGTFDGNVQETRRHHVHLLTIEAEFVGLELIDEVLLGVFWRGGLRRPSGSRNEVIAIRPTCGGVFAARLPENLWAQKRHQAF